MSLHKDIPLVKQPSIKSASRIEHPAQQALVEMPVRELIDAGLEWAVCMCEKLEVEITSVSDIVKRRELAAKLENAALQPNDIYSMNIPKPKPYVTIPGVGRAEFSTNWAHGGKIIGRVGIDVHQHKENGFEKLDSRFHEPQDGDIIEYDPVFRRQMIIRPKQVKSNMDGKCFARLANHSNVVHWSTSDFMSETHLVAACRCYVHHVFGEVISIPISLIG